MNCLRHELCPKAHWLPFNSWRRQYADEKSWPVQFMMREHQFIYHNKQSKNRRFYPFILALFLREDDILPYDDCRKHSVMPFGHFMWRSHISSAKRNSLRVRLQSELPCVFIPISAFGDLLPFFGCSAKDNGSK